MKYRWLLTLFCFFSFSTYAQDNILNVYIWSNEVPDSVIRQFERETGIRVNYSTYDSNETLYAKLKANPKAGYDVIEPTNYFLQRMGREGMLQKLDKNKLPNYKNLDPQFLNTSFDPEGTYGIPYLWAVTGIFVNKNYYSTNEAQSWESLWNSKFKNQILMLDDVREAFSIAFLTLGYSINDSDPEHIHQAYLKLVKLLPNIKLFNNDAVPSIISDDDATIGLVWNGDFYKAAVENPAIEFIYPKEGFAIWVDCFAIPINAPNSENAYKFLNYMMRPDVAMQSMVEVKYAVANTGARALLPSELRNNTKMYPLTDILKNGEFQSDITDEALRLYQKYWELLKVQG
jgi:spermidine/putrescine transport system substrate-binding protein